jgi:hypothetical protein
LTLNQSAKTFSLGHTYSASGNYTVSVTITDKDGGVGTGSFIVTVNLNTAPVVANAVPDQAGTYGVPFSYALAANTFNDPDAGQTLSYTASGLPAGITFDAATRSFSGTPTQSSTFPVTVTATDDGTPSLSVSDTFNILVAKATPLITWANPADINCSTPLGSAQLNATANVPGTFTYNPLAGMALSLGGGQVLTATFTPTDSANYEATFATTTITVRLDAVAEAWVQRYNGPNGYCQARAMVVDASGNVVVAGYSYNSGGNADSTTRRSTRRPMEPWFGRNATTARPTAMTGPQPWRWTPAATW